MKFQRFKSHERKSNLKLQMAYKKHAINDGKNTIILEMIEKVIKQKITHIKRHVQSYHRQ